MFVASCFMSDVFLPISELQITFLAIFVLAVTMRPKLLDGVERLLAAFESARAGLDG